MFKIDLHVHTVKGSSDSSLLPQQLIEESQRIGLDGVCLTEHGGGWNDLSIDREFAESGLIVIPALEVTTDLGHVIAIGLETHYPGIHKIEILRKVVDEKGGVLISAHPLRNFFNAPPYNLNLLYKNWNTAPTTPLEAAKHELFSQVDYIEVTNGANSDKENSFTLEIAKLLGVSGTGGSDSHSTQGLGKSLTVFENPITSKDSLIRELKSGAFYAAEGLNVGNLRKYNGSE